eukprot:scaffold55087_cov18-Prasinocladus_malaysianus.AAC.1
MAMVDPRLVTASPGSISPAATKAAMLSVAAPTVVTGLNILIGPIDLLHSPAQLMIKPDLWHLESNIYHHLVVT